MVIGLGKLERFSKSPWECKNEMSQGCLKEWSRPGMSKGIKWAEEAQDDMKTDLVEILGNLK